MSDPDRDALVTAVLALHTALDEWADAVRAAADAHPGDPERALGQPALGAAEDAWHEALDAFSGAAGTVRYTVPETKQAALPAGTVFPMMHTAAIIAAAEGGKRFIAVPIFDGTGDDGAQDSSVVITGWNPPEASAYPGLAALPSGRVRVAFYDRTKAAQNPDYEVGMRYWANGVADDLQMDFSDFVMQGKLSELTLPSSGC